MGQVLLPTWDRRNRRQRKGTVLGRGDCPCSPRLTGEVSSRRCCLRRSSVRSEPLLGISAVSLGAWYRCRHHSPGLACFLCPARFLAMHRSHWHWTCLALLIAHGALGPALPPSNDPCGTISTLAVGRGWRARSIYLRRTTGRHRLKTRRRGMWDLWPVPFAANRRKLPGIGLLPSGIRSPWPIAVCAGRLSSCLRYL